MTARLLEEAPNQAGEAAGEEGAVPERIFGILGAKLDAATRLHQDSLHHAEGLLSEESQVVSDLVQHYLRDLAELLVAVLGEDLPEDLARERTDILLALTRGLESDLTDFEGARYLSRQSIGLVCPETLQTEHSERPRNPKSTAQQTGCATRAKKRDLSGKQSRPRHAIPRPRCMEGAAAVPPRAPPIPR